MNMYKVFFAVHLIAYIVILFIFLTGGSVKFNIKFNERPKLCNYDISKDGVVVYHTIDYCKLGNMNLDGLFYKRMGELKE